MNINWVPIRMRKADPFINASETYSCRPISVQQMHRKFGSLIGWNLFGVRSYALRNLRNGAAPFFNGKPIPFDSAFFILVIVGNVFLQIRNFEWAISSALDANIKHFR